MSSMVPLVGVYEFVVGEQEVFFPFCDVGGLLVVLLAEDELSLVPVVFW